ncbi:nucleotidyltransferase domain-containing protein [soil metagenome]
MPYGLQRKELARIQEVFSRHPQVKEVILYGSRALGTHRKGSDIDITLTGKGLNLRSLSKIEADLDDLLLPYPFDVSVFRKIENPELRNHIERVGKVIYRRDVDLVEDPPDPNA